MGNTNCNQIIDMFSAYVDNALPTEQAVVLQEHLRQCPVCKQELQEWLEISQVLKNIVSDSITAPAGMRDNIMQALGREQALTANGTPAKVKKKASGVLSLIAKSKHLLAVAAAALAITFGSWGIGLQMAGNDPTNVAVNSPNGAVTPIITEKGANTGSNHQVDTSGDTGTGKPPGTVSESGSNADNGGQKGSANGTATPNNTGVQPPAGTTPEPGREVALLDSEMNTRSASAWIYSDEPGETVKSLEALAGTYSAAFKKQSMDPLGSGKIVVNITVAADDFDKLLANLEGSGNISDLKVENTDLSGQYKGAYQQTTEIRSAINDSSGNEAQLQGQLKNAEELMKRLEAQTKQYTVTVWVN